MKIAEEGVRGRVAAKGGDPNRGLFMQSEEAGTSPYGVTDVVCLSNIRDATALVLDGAADRAWRDIASNTAAGGSA